ncbi:hypothetical protein Nepgr_012556 [Nepenthes gracilis]|uniref:Uncharacterized protein n=1 Tax=Nepenthes gracilis TaxID=150966 RepID=A0AAD3SG03_NEPGR|nr:hypothetical protein Nepgr_012556 [Nepenthes gracilis]
MDINLVLHLQDLTTTTTANCHYSSSVHSSSPMEALIRALEYVNKSIRVDVLQFEGKMDLKDYYNWISTSEAFLSNGRSCRKIRKYVLLKPNFMDLYSPSSNIIN